MDSFQGLFVSAHEVLFFVETRAIREARLFLYNILTQSVVLLAQCPQRTAPLLVGCRSVSKSPSSR